MDAKVSGCEGVGVLESQNIQLEFQPDIRLDIWRVIRLDFPGRLTRDSQVVSLVIPRFPDLFLKKDPEKLKIHVA